MKLKEYEIEHLKIVRAGLAECMVLLKSNGAFPLDRPCNLAAHGNGVRKSVKGGTGSGEVNSRFTVNIEQGLINAGFKLTTSSWLDAYEVEYAKAKKGYKAQLRKDAKAAGMNYMLYSMGAVMPEPNYDLPLNFDADAAIYVLSRISGEGNDRKAVEGDFLLSKTEIRDILELNRRYEKFMLVINAGGPVDLSPVLEVKNILVLSQLGVEMGDALADVLLGKANPSGKLTTTWSAWDDYCKDVDISDSEDTYYREGVYVGYRYFDTLNKRALFPFGYGVSYTTFELKNGAVFLDETRVKVCVDVVNTGFRQGKEVVQVYVTSPENKLKKPYQDLAGFAKTAELKPGESQQVTISFDMSELACFDEDTFSYILEGGDYIVRVGNSSVDTVAVGKVSLLGDVVLKQCRKIVPSVEIGEKVYNRVDRGETLTSIPTIKLGAEAFVCESMKYDIEPEIEPEVAGLSDEELVYLGIGSFSRKGGMASIIGSASVHVVGAAGETTSDLEDRGFKPLVMADGPAGLRLTRTYFKDDQGLHGIGRTGIPESMLESATGLGKILLNLFTKDVKAPEGAEIFEQYCTAIPIGTAIAQSWNLDYAKECGDIVGDEMERFGVHLWLAPALNIHRSVLCGRNFEYYSEDPLVSGLFAAAITNGVQGHKGCGTTIKHFAANNQELNRYASSSMVSERTLREIYLKGFGICVRESQPKAVMTSYNLINGIHANEIRGLSEDYLRMENGFEGIIMTDWIVAQMPSSGKYRIARADEVAKAGGDLFMPGSAKDYDNVMSALKDGRLSRHQLEVNSSRILRMINELANNTGC